MLRVWNVTTVNYDSYSTSSAVFTNEDIALKDVAAVIVDNFRQLPDAVKPVVALLIQQRNVKNALELFNESQDYVVVAIAEKPVYEECDYPSLETIAGPLTESTNEDDIDEDG